VNQFKRYRQEQLLTLMEGLAVLSQQREASTLSITEETQQFKVMSQHRLILE
jgi:hypothetical protein